MRKVSLFVEDFGHEAFLKALVQRLADQYGVAVAIRPYSVRGGHGKVLAELRQYRRDLERHRELMPDLLVIGTDGNCQGFSARKREIDRHIGDLSELAVYAIPNPHIERWLLLDAAAFKAVFGQGCAAPDRKCERQRYKTLLREAIRNAGIIPLLGGIEYAEDLVKAMHLRRLERADRSFRELLRALHGKFRIWEQA